MMTDRREFILKCMFSTSGILLSGGEVLALENINLTGMEKQILETWEIHQRINLYLLDGIDESFLKDVSASKGRSVGEQFAHIHNVRLMWMQQALPELIIGIEKLEKENFSKSALAKGLSGSAKAIGSLLAKSMEAGHMKGFKPHPVAFMGYLISHESHHRGQILLSLKQNNHMVDKKIQFGIWEWGVR